MQIYALFMLLGIFTTLLIPETKRMTLEKLSGEYDMSSESSTEEFGPTTPQEIEVKASEKNANGSQP